MAIVYRNGDRVVIAREDDNKESQGFPRMSLQKRSAASNILKEQENQNPKVKAAAVEFQAAEQLDMVASRLDSTLGAAYSSWSPLRRAFSWWYPLMPDPNTGAATSQEGLEMAAAPLETASSSLSSSSSLPSPGVKASHQNQK